MADQSWGVEFVGHLRRARTRAFGRLFRIDESARVLDVGGTWFNSTMVGLMRHFRRARMRAFERMFHLDDTTRVLDVGGTRFNWTMVGARPRITMVNIAGETGRFDNVEMVLGDATALPFPDVAFDVVYSNSVVEHVGDWSKIEAYAANVRRLAPRYYVQTPNKWFPVEPHCMGIFLHWLPFALRRRVYRWLSFKGWLKRPTQAFIDDHLRGINLLTKAQVQRLFPDATIIEERTWLFPFAAKSFIAVRGADEVMLPQAAPSGATA